MSSIIISVITGSISGNLEHALEHAGGSDWNYAEQGMNWPKNHPICAGKRQSPIDIDTSKVFKYTVPNRQVDFRYTVKSFFMSIGPYCKSKKD